MNKVHCYTELLLLHSNPKSGMLKKFSGVTPPVNFLFRAMRGYFHQYCAFNKKKGFA